MPTLELDDGSILTESSAIIEWLDESYPARPLLPAERFQRARVRELTQLVNAGIHPLQNTITRKAIADDEAGQARWAARWIERGLSAYEAQLNAHPARFSVGDSLTMADLFLVPQTLNAERFGADITSCTRVRAIFALCMAMPEAQATHPSRAVELATRARAAAQR